MDSVRFISLFFLLSVCGPDSIAGKLEIFSRANKLILRSSKCNKCLLLSDTIHNIVDPRNIRIKKNAKEFEAIYKKCRANTDVLKEFNRILEAFLRRSFKWCGNNGDKSVENCCRLRSECPYRLDVSEHQSLNGKPFSINHCDCEKKFAHCLRSVGNKEALKVTKFHFHVFPNVCLTFDHPIHCHEKKENDKPTKNRRRMNCTTDEQKPRIWQLRSVLTGDVVKIPGVQLN